MKKIINTLSVLFLLFSIVFSVNAQVKVGNTTGEAHEGSLLHLGSNGGLLLSEVELSDTKTYELAGASKEAVGMLVYNKNESVINGDGKGVYIWDGTQWLKAGKTEITAYDCSTITGTTLITIPSLTNINLDDLTIPYSKKGGDIALEENSNLGTVVNGLIAQVKNTQTLTNASGNLNIKITGTPDAFGTFNIPITAGNNTCFIPVTIAQSAGVIGTLGCSSVGTINVTEGTPAEITGLVLPYSNRIGANISLTDNQVLGSVNGLSVQVDGVQTLSTDFGDINIKITGTPTVSGNISIPITLSEANCNIAVSSAAACIPITGLTITGGVTITQKETTTITLIANILEGAATSYEWYRNSSLVATTTTNIYTVPQAVKDVIGTNAYTVKAINSCSNELSITPTNVIVNPDPEILPRGTGTFLGKVCFDIAFSNDNTNNCALLSSRIGQKTNFANRTIQDPSLGTAAPYSGVQVYTFTPSGTVSNVRFEYKDLSGKVIASITPNGTYSGNISSGTACKVTVNYKTSLDTDLKGLTRANALKAQLYVIFNNKANVSGEDVAMEINLTLADCSCCGAATVAGGWLTFMCHNLGVNTSLDPFTSSNTVLKGSYYQWGQTNTNWVSGRYADRTSWGDGTWGTSATINPPKGPNDPCPYGWKVPSRAQWLSINTSGSITPNSWTWTGSGYLVGQTLYLPAGGYREGVNSYNSVGSYGAYWTTTLSGQSTGSLAYILTFESNGVSKNNQATRDAGANIRCVAE